jgi:imidazolonepropionase-like amidohydrolase
VVATLHVAEVAPIDCHAGLANARTFVAAGGTLLYGSDLGNGGVPVGPDVRELQLLVQAGLTRAQALAAATSRAGRELGLAPLGSLVPGAPADLWAVRGDALTDLASLGRPLLVVRAGRVVRG